MPSHPNEPHAVRPAAPVAPTTDTPAAASSASPRFKPLPLAPEPGAPAHTHDHPHTHVRAASLAQDRHRHADSTLDQDDPTHGEGTARLTADPEVCGDGLIFTTPAGAPLVAGGRLKDARRLAAQLANPTQPAPSTTADNALAHTPNASKNQTIHMVVYGCQMNKADGELIGGMLAQRGYTFTPSPENADVILFETCSVRKQSEDRVFSALGNLKPWKKRNPAAIIGVLGCMAQKEGRAILDRNPHVDLVVGTSRLQDVPDLIEDIRNGHPPILATETGLGREADFTSVIPHRENRFQAWLPIIRGCDKKCTYCVVPYTRGPEASLPMSIVIDQVKRLVSDGVREITLLGQTVDTYGEDLGDPRQNLANLLIELDSIPDLWRIRFITSYPAKLSEDVFRAIADCKNVCAYAHMPVQSGSDRMLKRMKRGYKIATYRETVAKALKHVPHLVLATDFIVGFCGETEEDYEASRALMEEIRFHTAYVFKYSPREGTPAMKLPDDVPQEVKERRNGELLTIQRAIAKDRQAEMIGTTQELLVEGPDPRNAALWIGRTRSNRTVAFSDTAFRAAQAAGNKPVPASLTGCLTSVKIHRSAAHLLTAELAEIVKR